MPPFLTITTIPESLIGWLNWTASSLEDFFYNIPISYIYFTIIYECSMLRSKFKYFYFNLKFSKKSFFIWILHLSGVMVRSAIARSAYPLYWKILIVKEGIRWKKKKIFIIFFIYLSIYFCHYKCIVGYTVHNPNQTNTLSTKGMKV